MNFTYIMILSMMIWGVSWVAGKIISSNADQFTVLFWRNILTSVSLFPVIFILKLELKLTLKTVIMSFLASMAMLAYSYLFFLGLQKGMAGAAGVLVTSLNPIMNFALVCIFNRHKLNRNEAFGLVLGASGGLIQMKIWNESMGSLYEKGIFLFLLASFLWAVLSFITEKSKDTAHPIYFSFLIYSISAAVSSLAGFSRDLSVVFSLGTSFWVSLFYLSVISTSFATTSYLIAASRIGSHKASSFIFLVPSAAVLSSWIILGEVPVWNTIAGGTLSIAAVYLIQKASKNQITDEELIQD